MIQTTVRIQKQKQKEINQNQLICFKLFKQSKRVIDRLMMNVFDEFSLLFHFHNEIKLSNEDEIYVDFHDYFHVMTEMLFLDKVHIR